MHPSQPCGRRGPDSRRRSVMAVISCLDCEGKVSTNAKACPHCGAPLGPSSTSQAVLTAEGQKPRVVKSDKVAESAAKIVIALVLVLLVGGSIAVSVLFSNPSRRPHSPMQSVSPPQAEMRQINPVHRKLANS